MERRDSIQEKSTIKTTAFLLVGVILLCSCTNGIPTSNLTLASSAVSSISKTTSSQTDKTIVPGSSLNNAPGDLNNLTDVTNIYVAPLNNDCLFYSWASASQIKVGDILIFCSYNNLLNLPDRMALWWQVPEAAVEAALQKHFDVSADYLRTVREFYDKKTQTYDLRFLKKEPAFRAISATQKGNRIEIEVGFTMPDDGKIEDKNTTLLAGYAAVNYTPCGEDRLIFPSGTLTVELTGDNMVKYISYKCNETFQKETDKLNRYKKYAEAFKYEVGMHSWNSAEQIEPDAFVVYYIYLCGTGEVTRPLDVPIEKEFGSPYMPQDILEAAVMKHFDIPLEHIRKSQYYDKTQNAYWSGGIGTLVDTEIVSAKQEGNRLTLTMKNSITSSEAVLRWDCKAVLELDGDGYKYISYTQEEVVEE